MYLELVVRRYCYACDITIYQFYYLVRVVPLIDTGHKWKKLVTFASTRGNTLHCNPTPNRLCLVSSKQQDIKFLLPYPLISLAHTENVTCQTILVFYYTFEKVNDGDVIVSHITHEYCIVQVLTLHCVTSWVTEWGN